MRTDLDKRSISQKAYDKHQAEIKGKPEKKSQKNRPPAKLFIEKPDFIENTASQKFEELEMFFKECARIIAKKPYCIECGEFISKGDYRNASAHVLPKKNNGYAFPSIAAEIDNFLGPLGARCGCHARYDHSWERASQMKVWPLAIEKITRLYPLIAKEELKNLNQIILDSLPKNLTAK